MQSALLGPAFTDDEIETFLQGQGAPYRRLEPEALIREQGEYEIEYESPATRMQRVEELVGIQRTIEIMAPFVQIDPQALQIFKPDEVARLAADIQGVPQIVLNSPEELEEIRAAAAEAQQAQQAAAAVPDAASALKDVATAQREFSQVPEEV